MPHINGNVNVIDLRPMLAATLTPDKVDSFVFDGFASVKLDGIRATTNQVGLISRTGKLIPNGYIQRTICEEINDTLDQDIRLDGELLAVKADGSFADFGDCESLIMSRDKIGDFKFAIFDIVVPEPTYVRNEYLEVLKESSGLSNRFVFLDQIPITSASEFREFHIAATEAGYEGTMYKHRTALYKHGRGTLRDKTLVKYKDFVDSEAVVVGWRCLMINNNAAETSELGFTKRSKQAAGLNVDLDRLGSMQVRDIKTGQEFSIHGFTDKQRIEFATDAIIGQTVTYKYFPYGGYDKPRHPVFKGFRHDI